MPFITFTRNTLPHEHGRDHPGFKAGETVDLPGGSCDRWKARGAAVDAGPKPEVIVSVVGDHVFKRLVPPVVVTEADLKAAPPVLPSRAGEGLRMVKRPDGMYDVMDLDDKVINALPLDKPAAKKLAKGGA